jgi:CRISPR-associated protein Csx17
MNRILLEGCRPEPLASYLKALGMLRLVSSQADPTARGHWTTDGFVLTTVLSQQELLNFFLRDYQPTPILSPWNGRGGFKPGKPESAEIQTLSSTEDPRFECWREAIQVIQTLKGLSEKHKPQEKRAYLQELRNRLPDAALDWLDAVALVTDSDVHMPPVGGTGGNEGSADYSSNFQQYLIEIFGLGLEKVTKGKSANKSKSAKSAEWLESSVFGQTQVNLLSGTWGQFDPGSGGGSNSAPHMDAKSLVNPWDFIFALEGLVVFSGAAVRRQGQDKADVSLPFSFQTSNAGYASASIEKGRGEIWAPLWAQPTTAPAVNSLFAEGRMVWGGSSARTGLDAARSLATLQHDRRITGFARYIIVERFGQNNIAVGQGVFSSPQAERGEVSVSQSLDRWTYLAKKANSRGLDSAVHRLDKSLFELATIAGTSTKSVLVLGVLESVALLDQACALSAKARKEVPPISRLHASEWKPGLLALLESELEARIAWSLASGRDDGSRKQPRSIREFVFPVDSKGMWSKAPVVEGFGVAPISKVLAEIAARREWSTGDRPGNRNDKDSHDRKGCRIAFERGGTVHARDAIRFASGDFDEKYFYRCLVAFTILDFRQRSGGESNGDIPSESGSVSNIRDVGSGFDLGVPATVAAVLMHAGPTDPAIPSPVGLARQLETNSSAMIGALKRSIGTEQFIPHLPEYAAHTEWLAASLLLAPDIRAEHAQQKCNPFLARAGHPSPAVQRSLGELRRPKSGDPEETPKPVPS